MLSSNAAVNANGDHNLNHPTHQQQPQPQHSSNINGVLQQQQQQHTHQGNAQQHAPQDHPHHPSQHHHHSRQDEDKARQRAEQRAKDIAKNQDLIFYSARYYDEEWEYRHVSLPKLIARYVPNELMTEEEWRSLGVKQSQGWEHYMIHSPEPHVLLFKREKDYQAKYPNGTKP